MKQGKTGARKIRTICAAAAVLVLLATLGAYGIFDHYASLLNSTALAAETEEMPAPVSPAASPSPTPAVPAETFHILLIGEDTVPGEAGRSDSMIIVSVIPAEKKIVLCSLMRDIYCRIPGQGCSRLNHAYAWGGAKLLLETIRENFDIPVQEYMAVNMDSFVTLVDALGGAEIELTAEEGAYLDGRAEGLQTLDGKTALEYVRIRSLGNGDFERTARQRRLLCSLADRLKTLKAPQLDALAQELLPQIETNIEKKKLLSLVLHAGMYLSYDIESRAIPFEGTARDMTVDGMMVLEIDLAENQRLWKETVYGN